MVARLRLLAQPRATAGMRLTLTAGAVLALGLPVALVLLLWWA